MLRLVWLGWLLSFATGYLTAAPIKIRVATYNASLNRNSQGQLASDLSTPSNAHAKKVAEIIQRIAPDIVLINEFDVDPANPTLARDLFHNNYLAVSQNGQPALDYPHRYAAPSNTGVASGFDLDNNGFANTSIPSAGASSTTKERYGNDCFGFGWFPGHYSFVVYSKFPIQTSAIRTFQFFKWKDMPGAVLPDDANTTGTSADWYSSAELAVLRLSSKNHVDLPIEVKPGQIVHLLPSHPTPPAFDGAEDRNGRRNHDEIRFWADYVSDKSYIADDTGAAGGLSAANGPQRFVIMGDLNADPFDGDSFQDAIAQLRSHPLINSAPNPSSLGGPAEATDGNNPSHTGPAAYDTADFNDFNPGNLRVDYVLPSNAGFLVGDTGVFWPREGDPGRELIDASDHHLVWIDLTLTPVLEQSVRNLQIKREDDDVVLTWETQVGVSYTVEWADSLGQWQVAPEIPIALQANSTAEARDLLSESRKFYRIRVTLEQ